MSPGAVLRAAEGGDDLTTSREGRQPLPEDIVKFLIATPPVLHKRPTINRKCGAGCLACEYEQLRARALNQVRPCDQLPRRG